MLQSVVQWSSCGLRASRVQLQSALRRHRHPTTPPPRHHAAAAAAAAAWLNDEGQPRRLYILCWREHSLRKLSPTLVTPATLVLITLVAQYELSRRKIGLLLEVVGRKFSHRPGNPVTIGVVRWPAAGDTTGSSLRRLSSLQHRIYNLLGARAHVHGMRPPHVIISGMGVPLSTGLA